MLRVKACGNTADEAAELLAGDLGIPVRRCGLAILAGVVFRDAEALEMLRRIDTLIVDKTGTLTLGRPVLATAIGISPFTEEDVLRIAASIDQGSEHPLCIGRRFARPNRTNVSAPGERQEAHDGAQGTLFPGCGWGSTACGETPVAAR